MTYSEFLNVDDIATITGYSKGKSGNVIRALNNELKEKGIHTCLLYTSDAADE